VRRKNEIRDKRKNFSNSPTKTVKVKEVGNFSLSEGKLSDGSDSKSRNITILDK